jgi:hypothetical protein
MLSISPTMRIGFVKLDQAFVFVVFNLIDIVFVASSYVAISINGNFKTSESGGF